MKSELSGAEVGRSSGRAAKPLSDWEKARRIFTVNYFTGKFGAIPPRLWGTHQFRVDGVCCALGFCRSSDCFPTLESDVLDDLFKKWIKASVTAVNDGENSSYPQLTPKERILAALGDIKAKAATTV